MPDQVNSSAYVEQINHDVYSTMMHLLLNGTTNTSMDGLPAGEQDEHEEQVPVMNAADIMGIYITGLFCLLGFTGNVLSFIVLLQAFGRSPMFLVLRAVAISDAVFLFSVFILMTLVNVHPYTRLEMFRPFIDYRGYIQFAIWPIMLMTQMATVWLTVLVSLERYVAICYPLRAASVCTITKVRRAVIIIFAFSILYNVPRFFEYKLRQDVLYDKTTMGLHEVYRYLYTCILYALLLFIIPLVLLVYLNLMLVLALRKGKREWQSLQFRQKKEQNLTIIPLTIVLVFFFCGTPSLVVNIIDSVQPQANQLFVDFLVAANFLVVLNSATNFVIYCLLGKKFRSKLADLCSCQCNGNYRVVQQLVNNTQMTECGLHKATNSKSQGRLHPTK